MSQFSCRSLACLASLSLAVMAQAGPLSGTIDLSTVGSTTRGVRFLGIPPSYKETAHSVSAAGDFNGDGLHDILIGDQLAYVGTRAWAGETFLVYGKNGATPLPGTIDLSTVGTTTPGVRFQGIHPGDEAGFSVSSAGDVNADGVDDVLIGAWRVQSRTNPGDFVGETYLVYGQRGGAALSGAFDLSTVGTTTAGACLQGVGYQDWAGFSVASAGDINADGIDDLLIGAAGASPHGVHKGMAYLLYGQPALSPISRTIELPTVGSSTPGVTFVGGRKGSDTYAGVRVSRAGDVNGDGTDDLLIGMQLGWPLGPAPAEVYLVYGQPGPGTLSGTIDLASVGGATPGARFTGVAAESYGFGVSSAGDVNGDGVSDILIGSPRADADGKIRGGKAYLIYGQEGPAALSGTIDLSMVGTITPGARFDAIAASADSGMSVSTAGDVNGDGIDDLLIGAPWAEVDGTWQAGHAYLVYGQARSAALSGVIDLGAVGTTVPGARFQAAGNEIWSGYSVSAAGDVDGDGFDDLLIGAPRAPAGYTTIGEAYLVYGQPVPEPHSLTLMGSGMLLWLLLRYRRRSRT